MRTKLMTLAAENGFSHAAPVRTVERQLGLSARLRDAGGCRGGHGML